MITIGRMNRLTALRMTSVGVFLGDNEGNDLLLPNKYVPTDLRENDSIEVFVYTDSEDRPIATTLRPGIERDQFGPLQCVANTPFGAFMDWGLEKDLLVPLAEQAQPLAIGRWYVVYCGFDSQSGRLIGSTRINSLIDDIAPDSVAEGDEVEALIYERTDLGLNAIVTNQFRGLFYANELFKQLRIGDRVRAYVKRVRDDGRVDLSLQPTGLANHEPNVETILIKLKANGGFLPLTDNTDPQLIYRQLDMSKKAFKRAVGTLYRERKIEIREDGIVLIEKP
jgi:uncharacterized protein